MTATLEESALLQAFRSCSGIENASQETTRARLVACTSTEQGCEEQGKGGLGASQEDDSGIQDLVSGTCVVTTMCSLQEEPSPSHTPQSSSSSLAQQ